MPRENRETGRGGKNLFDFWSYLSEDLLHSKNNLFLSSSQQFSYDVGDMSQPFMGE